MIYKGKRPENGQSRRDFRGGRKISMRFKRGREKKLSQNQSCDA